MAGTGIPEYESAPM